MSPTPSHPPPWRRAEPGPRPALRTGKQVGASETKTYRINWGWDQKRGLVEEADLWDEWTSTMPWSSINQLLEHRGIIKVRRPDSLKPAKVEVIKQLKQLGL